MCVEMAAARALPRPHCCSRYLGVIKRGLCLAEREESTKPAVQRCDCCGPKPSELSSRDTHFKDFGLRQRQ